MRWRFASLQLFFVLFCVAIIVRLSYWQVVKASDLRSQAQLQRTNSQDIVADRGEILDIHGFPLATNMNSYLLYANPSQSKEITASQLDFLSQVINTTDSGKLLSMLTMPNRVWVPITTRLNTQAREKIESLNIAGLGFENQSQRFYPEGSVSGHLLGFVGRDENGLPKGYFGLEGFYDKQLSGVSGKVIQETDALNRPIVIGVQNFLPAQEGRTLITSLDRTVQYILYQKLQAGLSRFQAVSGTVSVMDPKTGNILAMVSLPGYDPDKYQNFDPNMYKNPIVSDVFEPGSTFKTLIMAAGIDANVIKPDTVCNICSGPLAIGEYTVKTWNEKYYPGSTMTEVLQHSDNVGMVFVGRKLGKNKLLSYLKKFGIGEPTGIDIQEEQVQPLRRDNEWYEIDLATATFGQGIAVTPLQMLRAVSAIANKGKMVTPRMVTQILADDRKSEPPRTATVSVISPEAAAQVTEMMVNSVDRGEAKWAKPAGFAIAGKTGTAQIPVEGHYDKDKTIASFVGFAPAYDPKFVMLVTLKEPKSSPWGSETAAPLWFEISKELLRYYQVSPSF
jgi:stage V sporulation protein D (sporulation-specific penicillin-binding protein)